MCVEGGRLNKCAGIFSACDISITSWYFCLGEGRRRWLRRNTRVEGQNPLREARRFLGRARPTSLVERGSPFPIPPPGVQVRLPVYFLWCLEVQRYGAKGVGSRGRASETSSFYFFWLTAPSGFQTFACPLTPAAPAPLLTSCACVLERSCPGTRGALSTFMRPASSPSAPRPMPLLACRAARRAMGSHSARWALGWGLGTAVRVCACVCMGFVFWLGLWLGVEAGVGACHAARACVMLPPPHPPTAPARKTKQNALTSLAPPPFPTRRRRPPLATASCTPARRPWPRRPRSGGKTRPRRERKRPLPGRPRPLRPPSPPARRPSSPPPPPRPPPPRRPRRARRRRGTPWPTPGPLWTARRTGSWSAWRMSRGGAAAMSGA